jgi:hypothetical protein
MLDNLVLPGKLAKTSKNDNTQCWWGCGKTYSAGDNCSKCLQNDLPWTPTLHLGNYVLKNIFNSKQTNKKPVHNIDNNVYS